MIIRCRILSPGGVVLVSGSVGEKISGSDKDDDVAVRVPS